MIRTRSMRTYRVSVQETHYSNYLVKADSPLEAAKYIEENGCDEKIKYVCCEYSHTNPIETWHVTGDEEEGWETVEEIRESQGKETKSFPWSDRVKEKNSQKCEPGCLCYDCMIEAGMFKKL